MEALQRSRPPILRIAADGPRPQKKGEAALCAEARRVALEMVNWPCQVEQDFADTNLGCRRRVVTAITSFLNKHGEGIILEDDCVPDGSFFSYAGELLARYRKEPRVMMICGDAPLPEKQAKAYSYYFSRFSMPWGWATWKRAWDLYRENMEGWEGFLAAGRLESIIPDSRFRENLKQIMQETKEGRVDTWDYQWIYSYWLHHGLVVLPRRNLIANLGFGEDASHTFAKADPRFAKKVRAVNFPLNHPPEISVDEHREEAICRNWGKRQTFWEKLAILPRNLWKQWRLARQ